MGTGRTSCTGGTVSTCCACRTAAPLLRRACRTSSARGTCALETGVASGAVGACSTVSSGGTTGPWGPVHLPSGGARFACCAFGTGGTCGTVYLGPVLPFGPVGQSVRRDHGPAGPVCAGSTCTGGTCRPQRPWHLDTWDPVMPLAPVAPAAPSAPGGTDRSLGHQVHLLAPAATGSLLLRWGQQRLWHRLYRGGRC